MHDNSELALGTSTSTINTRRVTGAAGPPEHSVHPVLGSSTRSSAGEETAAFPSLHGSK